MLARFGQKARQWLAAPAWSSGVGLARTLIALGTIGTLIGTDPKFLMSPLANGAVPPLCEGMAGTGVWCVIPDLSLARWICVAILLLVASGWRPRLTAIPHWYVSWSLIMNVTLQDGGDQVTAVLTLLLLPICLTDGRRWHWQRSAPVKPAEVPGYGHIIARVTLLLIGIQMAGLYLNASLAKLAVPEWANGTAMFYWARHPQFGSAPWLRPITDWLNGLPAGVAAFTWGSIALEFALAVAIVTRPAARRVLLILGLMFHAGIAVHMGLISFGLGMSGGLLLYLLPPGHQVFQRIALVPQADRPVLIYDADCGFCTQAVRFMQRRLRGPESVHILGWQQADLSNLDLTREQVNAAVWLIQPDGSQLGGAPVFSLLARYSHGLWPVIGWLISLPPLSWLAALVYRAIAANRHRLPWAAACPVTSAPSTQEREGSRCPTS